MGKKDKIVNILLLINMVVFVIVLSIASITLFSEKLSEDMAFKLDAANFGFILLFIFNCLKIFDHQKNKNIFKEILLVTCLMMILLIVCLIFLMR